MSNFLRLHGLQHTRLPCPSPTPRACTNSCESNQWFHPTNLSSVIPLSFWYWLVKANLLILLLKWTSTEVLQFSSVAQLYPTLCDSMDCSTPGLPVHHQLLESIQTQVHWVSDAIQPSHRLSFLSPPTFSLSQHKGLIQICQFFASGGQSIGVSALASVLPMNIQG